MTRPEAANRSFVAALPDRVTARVTVIETPLLRIEPTGTKADLGPDDAAIFTSSNGVRFAPDGAGRAAFCVGPATTHAAKDRGWAAVEAGDTAQAMTRYLTANPSKQRLFHLSGTHTIGDVAGHLQQAGIDAHRVTLYDQVTCDLTATARDALAGEQPALIPLFSPRTARQLFDQTPDLSNVVLLALSTAIADCAPKALRDDVIVSAAPNASAMVEAIEETVDRLASG